jgi:hypothetical protein
MNAPHSPITPSTKLLPTGGTTRECLDEGKDWSMQFANDTQTPTATGRIKQAARSFLSRCYSLAGCWWSRTNLFRSAPLIQEKAARLPRL